jgi:hypothetical protein
MGRGKGVRLKVKQGPSALSPPDMLAPEDETLKIFLTADGPIGRLGNQETQNSETKYKSLRNCYNCEEWRSLGCYAVWLL